MKWFSNTELHDISMAACKINEERELEKHQTLEKRKLEEMFIRMQEQLDLILEKLN